MNELRVGKLLIERQAEDPLFKFEMFAPQAKFVQWDGSEAWYLGANRSGKSDALGVVIGSLARNGNLDPRPAYAGHGTYLWDRAVSIWVVSLSFDMSREIMQPKLFNNGHVPPGQPHEPFIPDYELLGGTADKAFHKTEHTLRLKNGSIVAFKAAEQRQSKLQGTGKDLIAFDEAPPKLVYNECVARVEAGRKLYIRGAATLLPPEGVVGGISWLYIDKIKPWKEGRRPEGLFLQGASIYDNPHIPRDEIARLESVYPPGSVDRLIRLEGAWLPQIVGSRAYPAFDSRIHVNPTLTPDKKLFRSPLLMGFDSNVEPCVAVVWQQSGRFYRQLCEIVSEHDGIPGVGREYCRIFPTHGAPLLIYGDATAHARTSQTTQSDYDILMKELSHLPYPVELMAPHASVPQHDRINAMNYLFRGKGGESRIEIAGSCNESIEDYETVQRSQQGGILKSSNKNDPYYRRTHASDAGSYIAVTREPIAVDDYGQASYGRIKQVSYHIGS